MTTDRAAKEATRNEIKAACGREDDAARVLVWMNGATRELGAIIQMLTEINMDRDDLSAEDDKKVERVLDLLAWMVGEDLLTTEMRKLKTFYTPGARFVGRNTL